MEALAVERATLKAELKRWKEGFVAARSRKPDGSKLPSAQRAQLARFELVEGVLKRGEPLPPPAPAPAPARVQTADEAAAKRARLSQLRQRATKIGAAPKLETKAEAHEFAAPQHTAPAIRKPAAKPRSQRTTGARSAAKTGDLKRKHGHAAVTAALAQQSPSGPAPRSWPERAARRRTWREPCPRGRTLRRVRRRGAAQRRA